MIFILKFSQKSSNLVFLIVVNFKWPQLYRLIKSIIYISLSFEAKGSLVFHYCIGKLWNTLINSNSLCSKNFYKLIFRLSHSELSILITYPGCNIRPQTAGLEYIWRTWIGFGPLVSRLRGNLEGKMSRPQWKTFVDASVS